jgi:PST family polysaccharide transporter
MSAKADIAKIYVSLTVAVNYIDLFGATDRDGVQSGQMTDSMINNTCKEIQKLQTQTDTMVKRFFNTEHLKDDLKERSVRGSAVTMTAQVIKFFLQTGSTVILARLLTPKDYGLVAMVTVITAFVALFKEMGLSMATVQSASLSHAQVSTLFWINVAVGIILALILSVGAPAISWFYNEPRLTLIALALASTFVFSGLTVQHRALLRRQMRFTTLATIEIGSIGIGITVAIIVAWYGAGYWALVGSSIAMPLGYLVLVWVFCGWRPGLPVRGSGILPMVAFGGHIAGFNIVNYFARNFDNILLGRFCGASVLGLYSRAYNIMMLPITQVREPLNAVAIPALSHIQNDPIRYKKYYIKMVTLLAFVTMPLMVFMFVCAEEVISLLLGKNWSGTVNIFKILCIVAFIQPVGTTWGLVLVSRGQSKRYFTWGIINSVVIVISFILGLPRGAIGVAAAYAVANYVLLAPTLWYSFKGTPISIMNFFSAIFRPVIASIVMGFVILLSRLYLTNMSDIVLIGCSFIIGFLTYLVVLVVLPGGLLLLQDFSSYRFSLFQKSK